MKISLDCPNAGVMMTYEEASVFGPKVDSNLNRAVLLVVFVLFNLER